MGRGHGRWRLDVCLRVCVCVCVCVSVCLGSRERTLTNVFLTLCWKAYLGFTGLALFKTNRNTRMLRRAKADFVLAVRVPSNFCGVNRHFWVNIMAILWNNESIRTPLRSSPCMWRLILSCPNVLAVSQQVGVSLNNQRTMNPDKEQEARNRTSNLKRKH